MMGYHQQVSYRSYHVSKTDDILYTHNSLTSESISCIYIYHQYILFKARYRFHT